MRKSFAGISCAFLLSGALLALPAVAETKDRSSAHSHSHGAEKTVYKGYFEDDQIKPRPLADWQGDWASIYPHLQDGKLDEWIAHKAESGDSTAEEYRAYYDTGFKTDVERIVIADGNVTFYRNGEPLQARYESDGYEILTYKKGNRGVRFIFRKAEGDAAAPLFIQFSDHKIAPEKSDHYHLYWGDDRAKILQELTNWPTYWPAGMSGDAIAHAMMAH
ncbi:metal-binding protein ZinT [Nitratireductor sp. XY-223]|uniref:ZinT family metal-binding protein n=1 Tax=Nitratireductor sp. XY-223 TaxID=2561926 RepID=UPI0010AB26F9|nr:metal-binding protein ZinT [Nitratireductor sp. XY-223]